jgi:ketosteroid isomerase-like protein
MLRGSLSLSPALFALTAAAADLPHSTAGQIAARKAVESALAKFTEAYQKLDAQMASGKDIYQSDDKSPDVYVLYDVMPPFADVGYQNVLEKSIKFMALVGPTRFFWTDTHIDGDENFAFFRGIFHIVTTTKDGQPLEYNGRHTIVFKKIRGKYLVVHEHASIPDMSLALDKLEKRK